MWFDLLFVGSINSIYPTLEKLENSNNETIHFEQERAINQVRQRIFQQALQGALGTLNGCLNNELHLRMIDRASRNSEWSYQYTNV